MPQLDLLVSSPGTGKTFYCIKLFKKEILKTKSGIESRSFFILPSREHAERIQNLILRRDVSGLFNAHILTINDLASRILGVSASRPPSDGLRKDIIREILEDVVPGKEVLLNYFHGVRRFKGFHQLLADAIKEFKAGFLTVSEFEKASQPLLKDPVFRSKFRDFSVLLKNYERRLDVFGLKEPEEEWLNALKEIPRMDPADLVIFDGFYHFTRAQRAMLRAVSRWSRHTVVTLTLSDKAKDRSHLFEYAENTRQFLIGVGFVEKGVIFSSSQRTKDAALLHLEKNLFSGNLHTYAKAQRSVLLVEANDLRAEVQSIAREIRRLHRETSCHYSDICLILRRVQSYKKVIVSVFVDFGIPVHVHEREKLIENGLIIVLFRFLCLGLENWKRTDLMFILKSFYLSNKLPLEEVLPIESIALSQNLIDGRERWQELTKRREVSENARHIVQALLQLEAGLLSAANIAEFSKRFSSCIEFFNVDRQPPETLTLDRQAIASLEAILKIAQDRYAKTLDTKFVPSVFMRELKESLEAGLFSVKPKGKNQVQVYDVVMALPKEYKIVFIPGLLEKVFPQNITEDPLFKDSERRVINRKEIVLEERLLRIAGERYFFYMAVTRAKERLYLSYPRHDNEGRKALASFFIEEAAQCFKGGLPLLRLSNDHFPRPDEWETEYEATRGLTDIIFRAVPTEPVCARFIHPSLPQVFDRQVKKELFKQILRFGFSAQEARLEDPKVLQFFRTLKGPYSATKLETLATCAFKYFSERILNLNQPLEGREALEMGSLLHQTLEEYYKELRDSEKENGAFATHPDAMKKVLHKKLEMLMSDGPFQHEPLYRQKMYERSMKGSLAIFAERESELFKRRDLVPSYFELKFGKLPEARLNYLEIKGSGGSVLIEGQIDRIDVTKDGLQALVIDYKRSKRDLTVHKRIEMGLEFQLPIYILAVKQLLGLDVLGAELRILREPSEEGLYRDSAQALLGLHGRAKRYQDAELERVLKNTELEIEKNLERLKQAEISVNSKSCKFCSFSSVCRFEPWRLVYSTGQGK